MWYNNKVKEYFMDKKSIITILAILILPMLAFWGLTFDKSTSTVAEALGKPQIIKFSSTMCSECKEVEKVMQEVMPKYKDSIAYTEIIVDSRNDMKNAMIKKHKVVMVPTIIMLNSDGSQYMRIETAIPAEQMDNYIQGLK
ncbi:MAG: thioredoxin family protein [Cyanobacteria bacterium SIG26]|nr:thioredoxin family protein [Cyanobacteria bacterium SIG26]